MNVGDAAKRGSPIRASPERWTLKLTTADTTGKAKEKGKGGNLGTLKWSTNPVSRMRVVEFG
jgi:hypothetical protein